MACCRLRAGAGEERVVLVVDPRAVAGAPTESVGIPARLSHYVGKAMLEAGYELRRRYLPLLPRLLLDRHLLESRTRTTGPYTETWTVMKDPEDNGFCVE